MGLEYELGDVLKLNGLKATIMMVLNWRFLTKLMIMKGEGKFKPNLVFNYYHRFSQPSNHYNIIKCAL